MSEVTKQQLITKFAKMLDSMTDEEAERVNRHFSEVVGAIGRFFINAYKVTRENWITTATGELMLYTDDEDFAVGYAPELWDSVHFKLKPHDATESIFDEVSCWEE